MRSAIAYEMRRTGNFDTESDKISKRDSLGVRSRLAEQPNQ